MQSRVLRLTVDLAIFFQLPMEEVPPDIDMRKIDEAIQGAVREAIPAAYATGHNRSELKVDYRFDVRKMGKLERGKR